MKDHPFTHLNDVGNARMVDVAGKTPTHRTAIAKARLKMNPASAEAIRSPVTNPKGDVLQVARIAGIQGAKRTSELIPLCHMIPLASVEIEFGWLSGDVLECTCSASATWSTGVEMEVLTGASIAALTVYDMCKAFDREMEVIHLGLWEKVGGKSGRYRRGEVDSH